MTEKYEILRFAQHDAGKKTGFCIGYFIIY
jgi:hypothetical protein